MGHSSLIRFVDLFCGIGGFRVAAEKSFKKAKLDFKCVFSSDIDEYAQKAYFANFGEMPFGDISKIPSNEIPDHDLLFAGFPCQPFSIIGKGKGFEDTRGTLFFEIARILDAKRPKAFILENVKQLVSHNEGKTFKKIIETLNSLGYSIEYKVLNALHYGLPQKRERVFIVGFHKPMQFSWPEKRSTMEPLEAILEVDVDQKHYVSDVIRKKRKAAHKSKFFPSIWHENKGGNVSSYPYSCALRAGASYNYLLVNGERRLTPREMLRLQGFPDNYKIAVPDSQVRKQAGNAVPVALVAAVLESLIPFIDNSSRPALKSSSEILKHDLRVYAREKIAPTA
ncbi:DNA cytosine methyltransferase [Leptospira kirschneri]|uniref:Cytosine-specific methyltransferase n=1 Tax=Leptospira kirschneri str. H1 TaxID=1049966 RepID=A0A0E2B2F6_9LEPT|nr:DNA (cytosine-5-)-methyltransferase [Leptospira kirschneri]EKO15450.1 putative modification methylase HhaI [Leptospira kirschneri str. H1]EKO58919.1 putative modification methylase HhaI [Leptospira kirschneri str. H2]UML81081.1 DNA (cytosine-5-)-methyltransferase [Leptospira kirschneri]